jgi:hypothetical protein
MHFIHMAVGPLAAEHMLEGAEAPVVCHLAPVDVQVPARANRS